MNQYYTPNFGQWLQVPLGGRLRQLKSSIFVSLVSYTPGKLSKFLQLTFIGFLCIVGQAKAADIYLNSGGSGAGTSWNDAKDFNTYFNTYWAAGAPSIPAGTHIYIKAGNYNTGSPAFAAQLNNNDILIQGSFAASSTGTDKTTYNPSTHPTVISGTGYFLGNAGSSSVNTNQVEIKGIEYAGTNYFFFGNVGGSGVKGTFKFTDLYIHNVAGVNGSVYFIGGNGLGSATFINCLFADNSTNGPGGAAINNQATGFPLNINNSTFTGNKALANSAYGGAIVSSSNLTVTNSYFCNNQSLSGGAIGATTSAATSAHFSITGSTFYNNTAGSYGGALGIESGYITVNTSNFYNNVANNTFGGGAICVVTSGTNQNSVSGSIFYNNGSKSPINPYGGGAISIPPSASKYQITNSKFVSNYVTGGYGGAICYNNDGANNNVVINGSLFYDNKINSSSTAANSDLANRYGFSAFDPDFVVNTSKLQLTQASYVGYGGGSSAYTFGTGANANTFSNTTDNGGVTSFTGTCPTTINPVAVNITGQVWDDVNGNVTFEGSENGTNAGGPLYVNLVDGTGTIVASTTVSATGNYTLTAPTNVTGYKLVLTNSPTSNTPGTLPTGWVNTGESVDVSNTATQGTTLGQIELNTGTTNVTAQNFGIEHLPTPGSGANTVPNAGGTSPVTVPANTFTNITPGNDNGDTPPGSVTAIHLTSFPTNATSLTINGTVYTSIPAGGITILTNASGAPTAPILVDPANDTQPVVFTYTAIDNAGKESTTTGTATLNFLPTLTVSGQVWDDVNGNVTFEGTENGTNAGGPLYVNLVDASGTLVGSTIVSPAGSYSLTGVPTNTTGLKLVLASTPTATTPGSLPSQWVNTGESVDASNPASQGSSLGLIELTTGTSSVTAQNFGIEHLPSPGSGTATVSNAGGTSPVTAPPTAFTNTVGANDNGDTPPGSVTAIKLTVFPSNVTSLTVNGTVYSSLPAGGITIPTDANGAPIVPILVDPTNDSQPVVFTYTAIDNAGQESSTTGTATLNFLAVPDLTPIIYARPSTVYNTTDVTVVVDVLELLGTPTSGTIVVKLTKDALVSLVFPPTATSVGDKAVQNSVWSVDSGSDPNYYLLTTSEVVAAGEKLSFGFTGSLIPGATSGTLTLSAVIIGGSGGEVKYNNNVDADKIDYFQQ